MLELAPQGGVRVRSAVRDGRRASTSRYGYTSRQIYGFAYRTLRRRMKVLGIEIPPAEELMPGPIDGTTEFAAVPGRRGEERL